MRHQRKGSAAIVKGLLIGEPLLVCPGVGFREIQLVVVWVVFLLIVFFACGKAHGKHQHGQEKGENSDAAFHGQYLQIKYGAAEE